MIPQYIPIQTFAIVAVAGLELQCLIMVPKFEPLFGRLGWTYGVENGTKRIANPSFLFKLYEHYRPISHRLATIHKVTDRAIRTSCLCYITSGIKRHSYEPHNRFNYEKIYLLSATVAHGDHKISTLHLKC